MIDCDLGSWSTLIIAVKNPPYSWSGVGSAQTMWTKDNLDDLTNAVGTARLWDLPGEMENSVCVVLRTYSILGGDS